MTVLAPVQAHIWDSNSSTKGTPVSSSKSGKGKQLHLGSFPTAVHAARAYDRAALLLRGPTAALNFPVEEYHGDPLLEVSRARAPAFLLLKISGPRALVLSSNRPRLVQ